MLKGLKKKFSAKNKDDKEIKKDGKAKVAAPIASNASSKPKTTSSPKPSDAAANKGSADTGSAKDAGAASAGGAPTAAPGEEAVLTKADLLKPIGSLQEAAAAARPALLVHKLRLCQVMFDWSEEAGPKDHRAKEVKRQQLLELVDFIGKHKNIFTEPVLLEIIKMVAANLFRALAPKQNVNGEVDEEDPIFDPSWPHLQIVYEFFLRFIVSSDVDVRTLKKHITGHISSFSFYQ
jgi:serine/threonine-protein phosphatase 2A regulatory subunit B'